MAKNKKIRILPIILTVLTLCVISFIWYRSTLSAVDSTVESTSILDLIEKFLNNIGMNVAVTDFIVRKSAHFCEFALLGCMAEWTVYTYFHKPFIAIIPACVTALLVASIDEYIQIFSPGRSSQFSDVMLDFSGAVAGIIFFLIIYFIYRTIQNHKRKVK